MPTTFQCKYCGKANEISEALTHQMEEQARANVKLEQQGELERVRKETELKTQLRLKNDYDQEIKEWRESSQDEKERNRKLLEQLNQLTDDMRQLRHKDEERELEMKQKLLQEEENIRKETRQKALEEHDLKDQEKDKKLSDALKQIEDLKTRIQQGSQQTQGEVLELELENLLRKEFPLDVVAEVKKGQRGADITQQIIDRNGKNCGFILWESKNGKWQKGWIETLKENQRQAKAHVAVLVTTEPPEGVDTFVFRDGLWITTRKMAVSLARALRYDLIKISYEKSINVGKNEKMEVLYQYITSQDFTHRIEAIVEGFGSMQEEIEREKRWFTTKWARQEKQLRQIVDHTQGMYGELQCLVGKSLPEMEVFQLPAESEVSGDKIQTESLFSEKN